MASPKAEIIFEVFERDCAARFSSPIKMSEVLFELIEPYRQKQRIETEEELRDLIFLAEVAWNAASIPARTRDEEIRPLPEEFRRMVYAMLECRRSKFSQINRIILGHQLAMTEGGPSLSVMSTVRG